MLQVRETYVNEDKGYQFGDSGWYEPYTDTRGRLFREFQREYGRCTSRIYADVPRADAATPVMPAVPAGDKRASDTVAAGWYFAKRMPYEDARGDPYTGKLRESDYYTRGVWVEVREVPDSK